MSVIGARIRSRLGGWRYSPFLPSVIILGLIVACLATAFTYRQSVPAHVDRDTINISESDYEQALAKWEARQVVEYTITVARNADQITIRVNRETGDIFLLEWLRAGHPYEGGVPDPNNPVIPGLYYDLSVDGMFDRIREWLDAIESGQPLAPTVEETEYFNDFVARFHPELGYPIYVANYVRSAHRTREVIWRSPARPILEVQSLTIMR